MPVLQWSERHVVDRPANMHQNALIFVVPAVALLTPWMQNSFKIVENHRWQHVMCRRSCPPRGGPIRSVYHNKIIHSVPMYFDKYCEPMYQKKQFALLNVVYTMFQQTNCRRRRFSALSVSIHSGGRGGSLERRSSRGSAAETRPRPRTPRGPRATQN